MTKGHVRALSLFALLSVSASTLAAQNLSMWARDSGAVLNERVVAAWNAEHPDQQIELTIIPANEMVTKFVTAASAGAVPDLLSLDLIFAPPFMKAGFLTDITDDVATSEHWANTVQAHRNLATYEDRIYGMAYAPDNSVLIYNKDLFRAAGLDPEDPPSTSAEILEAARAIRALGGDTYGFYFSGSCGGCNIFTMAPQMWASPDTTVIPRECGDEGLTGDSVPAIFNHYRTMWEEGLIPASAQVDGGTNFTSSFASGNIGIAATGNFTVGVLPNTNPDLDFGVAPLPGGTEGEISSFAGGDILTIPSRANNPEGAKAFMEWVLTDAAQQIFVESGNMPARTDIAAAAFAGNDRLLTTLTALESAQTPYTMNFFSLSNDPAGPWLQAIQTAVFDGDVDGAIATGRQQMTDILCEG